jgi:hypothetical protein
MASLLHGFTAIYWFVGSGNSTFTPCAIVGKLKRADRLRIGRETDVFWEY